MLKNATEEIKDLQNRYEKHLPAKHFLTFEHYNTYTTFTLLYLLLHNHDFTAENILMIGSILIFPAFSSVKPDTGLVFPLFYFS